MLDRRIDQKRRLDRLRHKRANARKRESRDQLRAYTIWERDSAVAEVVTALKRIQNPARTIADDLEKVDDPSTPRREYRDAIGRLLHEHHKRTSAMLDYFLSCMKRPAGF